MMTRFLFLLAITSLIFHGQIHSVDNCKSHSSQSEGGKYQKHLSYETFGKEFAKRAANANSFGAPAPIKIRSWEIDLQPIIDCDVYPDVLESFGTENNKRTKKFDEKVKKYCSELNNTVIPKMRKTARISFGIEYFARSPHKFNGQHANKIKNSFPLMQRIQRKLCSQFHTKLHILKEENSKYRKEKFAQIDSTLTTEQQENKAKELAEKELEILSGFNDFKKILSTFLKNRDCFVRYIKGNIEFLEDCVYGFVEKKNAFRRILGSSNYTAGDVAANFVPEDPTYITVINAFAKKAARATSKFGDPSDIAIQKWITDLNYVFHCNVRPADLVSLQAAIHAANEMSIKDEIEVRMREFSPQLNKFNSLMAKSTKITFEGHFESWLPDQIRKDHVKKVKSSCSNMIELQTKLCVNFCSKSSSLVRLMLLYQKQKHPFTGNMKDAQIIDVIAKVAEVKKIWGKFIENRVAFGEFLIGQLSISKLSDYIEGFVKSEDKKPLVERIMNHFKSSDEAEE